MTTTTFDGYCKLTQKDTFLQLQYNHSNHHQRHHNYDYRRNHKRHDIKGTIGRLICQFNAYGWTSKVGTAGIQLLHRTHNRRHQGYHIHNIWHKHSHMQHYWRKNALDKYDHDQDENRCNYILVAHEQHGSVILSLSTSTQTSTGQKIHQRVFFLKETSIYIHFTSPALLTFK